MVELNEHDFHNHADVIRFRQAIIDHQRFEIIFWCLIAVEITCGVVHWIDPLWIVMAMVAIAVPLAYFKFRSLVELKESHDAVGKWRGTWRYQPKP